VALQSDERKDAVKQMVEKGYGKAEVLKNPGAS